MLKATIGLKLSCPRREPNKPSKTLQKFSSHLLTKEIALDTDHITHKPHALARHTPARTNSHFMIVRRKEGNSTKNKEIVGYSDCPLFYFEESD